MVGRTGMSGLLFGDGFFCSCCAKMKMSVCLFVCVWEVCGMRWIEAVRKTSTNRECWPGYISPSFAPSWLRGSQLSPPPLLLFKRSRDPPGGIARVIGKPREEAAMPSSSLCHARQGRRRRDWIGFACSVKGGGPMGEDLEGGRAADG